MSTKLPLMSQKPQCSLIITILYKALLNSVSYVNNLFFLLGMKPLRSSYTIKMLDYFHSI